MKYRVTHEQRSKESLKDQEYERRVLAEENMDAGEIFNEEMKAAGEGIMQGANEGADFITGVGRVAVVDAPTMALNRTKSVVRLVVPP
jgi:hypothetical protein